MDLIQRPKKVQKAERGYLSNEKYQDYAENQFKTIYDYLDSLVSQEVTTETSLFDNENNSNTTITLSDSVANYEEIEVFYRGVRENKTIKGSQKLINANGKYINVNLLFRVGNDNKGSTAIYKINGFQIALETSSQYEFSNGSAPIFNNNNSIYITQVIGIRKE